MSNKDQVGKIQTVTGTIKPSELGKTSTHEHIFINIHTKNSKKIQKKFTILQKKIRKICEPSHAMPAPLETLFTQFRKAPGSTQLT